jgi:hypothetical protein
MNSEKSIILKAFIKQFFDFLEDILDIFPENKDIHSSHGYFTTAKKANPTILIKTWHENIYKPYSDEIEKGNLMFFLTKDYSSDIQHEYILDVIDKSLRQPLLAMDDTNKEHCTRYIKLLTELSVRYQSL